MQLRDLSDGDLFTACHEKEGELFVKLQHIPALKAVWLTEYCCAVKVGTGELVNLPEVVDVEPLDITVQCEEGEEGPNQLTQLTHTLEKLAPQDHTLERLLVGVHKALVMIFLDGRDNHMMAAKKLIEELEPLATVVNKRYDDSGG